MLLLIAALTVEAFLIRPYAKSAVPLLTHVHASWLLLALAAQAVSMAAFARTQHRMLAAAGTTVPSRRMLAVTLAANALSATLPAGAVVSAGYTFRRLQAWGADAPAAGFTLLASGALSTVTFAALAAVGALMVGADASSIVAFAVPIATVCATVVAGRQVRSAPTRLLRWLERPVRLVYRLTRRDHKEGHEALGRFVARITDIRPSRRDWTAGLFLASVNWLADLACLAAACRAVSLNNVGCSSIVLTYLAAMTVSSLPLLPGGIGVVDAAMVLVLLRGGVDVSTATAAVVLYRLISFVLVVAVGWVLWAAVLDRSTARQAWHRVARRWTRTRFVTRPARCRVIDGPRADETEYGNAHGQAVVSAQAALAWSNVATAGPRPGRSGCGS